MVDEVVERGRENKKWLDSTRRSPMMSPTASPTASQAWDDDVEETSDGTDDSLEDAGNAVDDCHEAGTDGAKNAFNLLDFSLAIVFLEEREGGKVGLRMIRRLPLWSCCAVRLDIMCLEEVVVRWLLKICYLDFDCGMKKDGKRPGRSIAMKYIFTPTYRWHDTAIS